MVGLLNTFGNIPFLPTRIVSGTFQITQAGGPVTVYTVPAGKTLYIESKTINCLPTLEPVASALNMKFAGLSVNTTSNAIAPNSLYSLMISDIQIKILLAGESITITNTLALGDCTIELMITGYLL